MSVPLQAPDFFEKCGRYQALVQDAAGLHELPLSECRGGLSLQPRQGQARV